MMFEDALLNLHENNDLTVEEFHDDTFFDFDFNNERDGALIDMHPMINIEDEVDMLIEDLVPSKNVYDDSFFALPDTSLVSSSTVSRIHNDSTPKDKSAQSNDDDDAEPLPLTTRLDTDFVLSNFEDGFTSSSFSKSEGTKFRNWMNTDGDIPNTFISGFQRSNKQSSSSPLLAFLSKSKAALDSSNTTTYEVETVMKKDVVLEALKKQKIATTSTKTSVKRAKDVSPKKCFKVNGEGTKYRLTDLNSKKTHLSIQTIKAMQDMKKKNDSTKKHFLSDLKSKCKSQGTLINLSTLTNGTSLAAPREEKFSIANFLRGRKSF